MRDRDHVGVELGDLLGRRDLAACRPRVTEIDDVELVVVPGHGRPRADRSRCDPAFRDRVAVREPPRLRGRRLDRSADGADRTHDRLHTLREIDDGALVGIDAAESEPDRAVAEDRGPLVDLLSATHDGERRARAPAAIPEVVGARRVGELDRFGVTHEFEPHADRQSGRGDGVAGQSGRDRRGRRVGTGSRPFPARHNPHVRRGRSDRHRSPIGYGNLAPTPPSTESVWPVT